MEKNNKCCFGIVKWTSNLRQIKIVKTTPIFETEGVLVS